MNILIVSFLKIKMKGLVFVNEVGIYLSLDLRMVYVSQLYVVKMFLNEFLGYEIQYVFNVTGNYFLDLNKTFQENQIAYGDILIYGGKNENISGLFRSISSKCLCKKQSG